MQPESTPPIPVPQYFKNIPMELRNLRQWVCWKIVAVRGRQTKVPYTPTGRRASSTDPKTWASFDQCLAAHNEWKFNGIGFVFSAENGLTGIDLDHHRDPQTGKLDPFAQGVVARLNTYTEISQSGTGVHIIAGGTIPGDKGRHDAKQGVEMYSAARFFVSGLFQEIFGGQQKRTKSSVAPIQPVTMSDIEIVNKASAARNGTKFCALWRGDFASAGYGSQSEADAALLSMLHFWTRGDKAQSFRLFSQSGLNRDKWEREDYRESTWQQIADGEIYSPRQNGGGLPILDDPRPRVRLPGDNSLLSDCADEIGRILAPQNIFTRGGFVVTENDSKDGLVEMTPEAVCWIGDDG